MYTHILIRYGELTIKGKNKKMFIQKLVNRLHEVFPKDSGIEIETNRVRSFLTLPAGVDSNEIMEKLQTVFGIGSASFAIKVPTDMEAIQEAALQIAEKEVPENGTFKVETKRSYKQFPLESLEISQQVGSYVFKNISRKVTADMRKPDAQLLVEIRKDFSYVMLDKVKMPGGFPQGSLGKGMLMLSGGIDSPVAGYLAMRKGIKIAAIHFASPPYTSPEALEKIMTLVKTMEKYQQHITVYVVPFTEIQQEIIKSKITDRYHMVVMRRSMYRIAERIMAKANANVIINGESIGQVASQTLASMNSVHRVVDAPIIQPLSIMEKNDIITIAKQIGTYETSILPFEDCCTIFVPKSPVTNPKPHIAEFEEDKVDFAPLEDKAVAEVEIMKTRDKTNDFNEFL